MVTLLSDPDYCIMDKTDFRKQLAEGIPSELPAIKKYDSNINHAPKRKDILRPDEKRLAVKNALRYFPSKFHKILAREFAEDLKNFGRIYMYRFRPDYEIRSRHIDDFPHRSSSAAAIMLMISNFCGCASPKKALKGETCFGRKLT